MKPNTTMWKFLFGIIAALSLVHSQATPLDVSSPKDGIPPNIVTSPNKPMMMITASKDHLLFGPIYTDFEDLDGDGVIDTTFKPTFKYYGYFDATKCYAYDNTNGLFNPTSLAIQTQITSGSTTSTKYSCPSSQQYWSGNFLNWATMTRLDIVRKMLYGGYRSIDTNGSTVLMGTRLVWDAHSFVKYYKETDIRDYTPFTTADLTKNTGANAGKYAGLSMCITGSSEDPKTSQPIMRLVKGNVRFWSTVESVLCRWQGPPDYYSAGTFGPKLARYYSDADKGNGGVKHEITIPSRANDGASYSGIGPDINVAVKACVPSLLGEEHCQAFPADSSSNYKPYGLFQEFGYPQTAGAAARAEFGLITGSYDYNHTAGALRKNIRDMDDEISRSTGVFCHSPSSGCPAKLSDGRITGNGAIKTFDSIILYGRTPGYYGAGNTPSQSSEGNLPAWGNPVGEMLVQALQYYSYNGSTPAPTNPPSNSADSSAGLPVVAWNDPLASSQDRNKYGNSVCRPLNILALSSSALSFDGQADNPFATLPNRTGNLDSYVNKIGITEGITGTIRSIGSVSGKGLTKQDDTNSCAAKTVGQLSLVNGICPEAPAMGGTYQIAGAALYGNTSKIRNLTSPPADIGQVENALKVKTLAASLTGGSPRIDVPIPGTNPRKFVYITPESVEDRGNVSAPLTFASINSGPTYGSFIVTWNDILMGGDYDMDITGFLRYDLIQNAQSPSGWDIKITTDIPGVCGGSAGTHGFSVIGVQKNGVNANGRYLTHQHGGNNTNYVTLTGMPSATEYLCAASNTAYLNTRISVNGVNKLYRDTVCSVTGNGQTGDPSIPYEAVYCTVKNEDYPVSMVFNMVGETDALIKDPLFYAAKYGAFKSSTKNADGTYTDVAMPTDQSSWDSVQSDGTPGQDGIPDAYFLARRPELLEAQLRRALDAAARDSNAAPAVSSAQLVVDSFKYVAKFDSTTVTGALEAYKVDSTGNFPTNYTWEAGALLKTRAALDSGNSRNIITNSGNNSNSGIPFRWASLPTAYKTQMTTASANKLSATNAEVTLNYVRGDQTKEGATGLRMRGDTLLGPIVNGTPWIQDRPKAIVTGDASYSKFYADNKNRSKLLWVAANDGMLHAFNTDTGAEVIGYIPGMLANRLVEIPMQRGTAGRTKLNNANFTLDATETQPSGIVWPYVDGNPFTADVKVSPNGATAAWKTYLFGTLGRGGKAIFALDVTNPSQLSEANAANIFKWQFTSDDDPDLGYIVGDVSTHPTSNQPLPVARLNNGKYALLIGNGNQSSSGKSVLFIIYVDGPVNGSWSQQGQPLQYKKIVVDSGSGNGLAMPRWEDLDGDGVADVAYAGDLKGNMWKFDLSSTNDSDWKVAYKSGSTNLPLFRAVQITGSGNSATTTSLPITTSPQTLFMARGGIMVMFGTGSAFDSSTFPNTSVAQRVYGIWDRPSFGSSRPLPDPSGSTLLSRVYTRDSSGNVYLSAGGGTLDWSVNDGWYFSLPGSSEAVLSDMSLDAGILTFVGVRPKSAANQCINTPDSTLYTLDPISGRAERNIQGTLSVNSANMNLVGRDIGDQKVRVVSDRTSRPFSNTCKAGEPGCVCSGPTCAKPSPTCGPGQGAKRVTGRNADATICYSMSPRLQWRDVPGMRTNK